jgi:cation transport regulator ChaC
MTETIVLFAYGAITLEYLKGVAQTLGFDSSIITIEGGRLVGYGRGFTNSQQAKLEGKGGKATLSKGLDCDVLGTLYTIPKAFLSELDKREGVQFNKYERKELFVQTKSGSTVKAISYVMSDYFLGNKSVGEYAPTREYLVEICKNLNQCWKRRGGATFRPDDINLHRGVNHFYFSN